MRVTAFVVSLLLATDGGRRRRGGGVRRALCAAATIVLAGRVAWGRGSRPVEEAGWGGGWQRQAPSRLPPHCHWLRRHHIMCQPRRATGTHDGCPSPAVVNFD